MKKKKKHHLEIMNVHRKFGSLICLWGEESEDSQRYLDLSPNDLKYLSKY